MARKKNQAVATTTAELNPEITEKVEAFFASNPDAPEVYSTPDGYLFTVAKYAKNHAATLEAEITTHTNPKAAPEAEPTEE